jgi:hypothetical protein
MKTVGLLCTFLLVVDAAVLQGQAPRRAVSDEQIVAQGQRVGSGTYVEIYQHGVTVDPSFLQIMESVYNQVETVMGVKLDTATLGPKVHVYVSDAVSVSHVWRGYQHPSDPRAIIFLNPRVYLGAMSGTNATHIHELTHLFTWRFTSHTLREGLADAVALILLPGAAVGPNPGGGEWPPDIPPEILAYLGTTKPPPGWLSTDRVRRRAYYFASHRFVSALVEMKGMETFMQLYVSENPEIAIISLYGISREEAIQVALRGRPE